MREWQEGGGEVVDKVGARCCCCCCAAGAAAAIVAQARLTFVEKVSKYAQKERERGGRRGREREGYTHLSVVAAGESINLAH